MSDDLLDEQPRCSTCWHVIGSHDPRPEGWEWCAQCDAPCNDPAWQEVITW